VSGCCYIGVDGDLGDSGISNFEVALCDEPFDDIDSNGSGELGGEPESFGLPFGWFWEVVMTCNFVRDLYRVNRYVVTTCNFVRDLYCTK
jgi:hypothetical protein